MRDLDTAIARALEGVTPRRDGARGDWDAVLRDARASRRRWHVALAPVAAAVAVVAALALAWPFSSEPAGVLDRARAAMGDGPVLHVVLEGSWGGELVDLKTGTRARVPGVSETWYDAGHDVIRSVSRLGDTVQTDETYRPGKRANGIAALGERYRDALQAGTARVFGEGEVEGTPVYWIVFHREDLPDVADNRIHPWTQQVAVSQSTYEPVAMRETRDGVEGPGTRQLVRTLEYVSAEDAGFGPVADRNQPQGGFYFSPGFSGPVLSVEQATDLLGRTPLWTGRELAGLPLARIHKEEMGRFDPVTHERTGGVGAVFVYGHLADNTHGDPDFDGPYAIVRETTVPPTVFSMGNEYVPPPGKAFVSANRAVVSEEGLFVRIDASSEELALSAARALRPVG